MESNNPLDLIFFALSSQQRRDILVELSEEPKQVTELASHFDMTLAGVSKNIKLLEKAELIYKIKKGRKVFCHMNFDTWKQVAKFASMEQSFWTNRLNELEDYIKGNR